MNLCMQWIQKKLNADFVVLKKTRLVRRNACWNKLRVKMHPILFETNIFSIKIGIHSFGVS